MSTLLRHASLKRPALSHTHLLRIILDITFLTVGALIIVIKSLSIDVEIKKSHYIHQNHLQSHIPLLSQLHKERGRVMKQGVERAVGYGPIKNEPLKSELGGVAPQHDRSLTTNTTQYAETTGQPCS
jgi:hypothetical protein